MPPSRRSQNLPLETLATPTRVPGRQKRLATAKHAENAQQEREKKERHAREQQEKTRKEGPS